MNTAQWTVLWPYSNPCITQAYYYPTRNTISNPSTKQEDSFRNRAQAKPTICSKRPSTPNPRIPHQQVSSASDCIRHHTAIATLKRNANTHRTRYVEVQIQYFGDTITTCYTIHSITIRHHISHTIEITLPNTDIHIKTNNAQIYNTLTQFLYTSYRYNPWNNSQLVAGSWRWSY